MPYKPINPMCLFVFFISVAVGYEYESCPGVIQWERRTALMQGFELVPSNLGAWSLDKHHALNIRSGTYQHTPPVIALLNPSLTQNSSEPYNKETIESADNNGK